MTARQLHSLTRAIAADIYTRYGTILTVGIYASNSEGEAETALKHAVEEAVAACPEVLQLHGFYTEPGTKRASFDLVVDFKADAQAVCAGILEKLKAAYPDYEFDVVLDSDVSD